MLLLWQVGAGAMASVPTANQVFFQQLSLDEAREQAGINDQLFFLYFAADWCLPCQWMEENTFADASLAAYVNTHYVPVKVDMDQAANQSLKAQFSVSMIPSILVFSAAGVLVDRQETTLDAQQMLDWLRELDSAANHRRQTPSRAMTYASSDQLLDAPRPVLGFSRPALIPEEDQPGVVRPASSAATPNLAPEPTRTARPSFSPRSTQQYTIALGPEAYTYADAVRRAAELEQQFDHRADLLPVADDQFRIMIGTFETPTAARRFLIFLNRNDLIGEVLTVGE